ncbi:MAG: winged helix-turn-helix domain-containing protein [Vicinamibacterales bacterium]
MAGPTPTYAFGEFELDLGSFVLRRGGEPIRIEGRPMDLLILLVERRGQLVTRQDIIDRLWGPDVFVDVEAGIHTAVRKIRQALEDSADRPRFVETVPGRGYRFVAEVVETAGAVARVRREPPRDDSAPDGPPAVAEPASPAVPPPAVSTPPTRRAWLLAPAILVALAAALAWPRGQAEREPPRPAVTLAVLPFGNLSGEAGYDYIADGLADETATTLGQVDPDGLGIVSRTATARYRSATKSPSEIGAELGADYLLESTLRAEGRRLRVTARLVRVRDQLQVWSQSWDREPTSMLGLQRELSEAITRQIQLRLAPDRADRLARRQTRNPDAYDLYLRGLTFDAQRTPDTTRRALDYYTQATDVDPSYSLAWAAMAATLASRLLNSDANPAEVLPPAQDAARRALQFGPDTAEAHRAQAQMEWYAEWDRWSEAEAGLRRALAIEPRSAMTHIVLGHVLSQTGRQDDALVSTRRARELDPLDPLVFALSSQVAFQGRDYQGALELADRAIALDGEFWIGRMMRGQALERLGQADAALEALTAAERFSGRNSKPLSLRAYILARTGHADQAEAMLDALAAASGERYVPPYAMALINAGLDRRDEVMRWLARAIDTTDAHIIYLAVDPKWDPYRTDPRFMALVDRCRFDRRPAAEGARR